jgi:hypothetical protein
MSIVLTEQQQRDVDAQEEDPPRVVDPRTNVTFVLVPEDEYEGLRELLEDERRQAAIHRVAVRNAVGRLTDEP